MPSFMIWQEDEKNVVKELEVKLISGKSTAKISINLTNHSKVRGKKVLANCKHLTEEYV